MLMAAHVVLILSESLAIKHFGLKEPKNNYGIEDQNGPKQQKRGFTRTQSLPISKKIEGALTLELPSRMTAEPPSTSPPSTNTPASAASLQCSPRAPENRGDSS